VRASRPFANEHCIALFAVCWIVAFSAATVASATDMTLAPRVPLPDQSLLEPPVEPDCKFKDNPTNPTAEQIRMKLDYEQQCYRQAEEIVRARLQQLQDSVRKTIRAVERRTR
jgi:hypothetical protein